ncbi:hypothetical protein DOTSEDRAFT_31514 [Dothistroma septosporum NZE10]|uniref:Uncharacterized protein n=1 Tax=Dothistroma septosporum (strain NZE10 / CBS 128990) TaxID=675120 RepID=N1PU61_DOTSN|nr:hypothetical protein DOTSEDRAFT_31514 [Dothistroma septosporum NZE10]
MTMASSRNLQRAFSELLSLPPHVAEDLRPHVQANMPQLWSSFFKESSLYAHTPKPTPSSPPPLYSDPTQIGSDNTRLSAPRNLSPHSTKRISPSFQANDGISEDL